MSLPGALTALVEFVGDVIVNDCDRPAPDRVLRYWGTTGLPEDVQCSENGTLSVSFDRGTAEGGKDPCPGLPEYVVTIRYDLCWESPEIDEGGINLEDTTWDADAAMLAGVADCVTRALLRLQCATDARDTAQALLAALRRNGLHFREVVPSGPGGSAVRIVWRVLIGPKSQA